MIKDPKPGDVVWHCRIEGINFYNCKVCCKITKHILDYADYGKTNLHLDNGKCFLYNCDMFGSDVFRTRKEARQHFKNWLNEKLIEYDKYYKSAIKELKLERKKIFKYVSKKIN
jgi:hypothetical protein